MQSFAFLAVLLFHLGLCDVLHERAGCNADNCLRKVTGTANTNPDLSSRLADCTSFLQVIVEPAPTTVTVTTTVYPVKRDLGGEEAGLIEARQATTTPSTTTTRAVPAYASPCSGAARYSSACSCAGVTAITSAAPPATVTVTETECSYGVKCNGVCTDTYRNNDNCGTCGNACPSGSTCLGQCLFRKDFECGNPELSNITRAFQRCKPKGTCICVGDAGSSLGGSCIYRRQTPNYCNKYPKCPGKTNAECPAGTFCWTNAPCNVPVCARDTSLCPDMVNPLLD